MLLMVGRLIRIVIWSLMRIVVWWNVGLRCVLIFDWGGKEKFDG